MVKWTLPGKSGEIPQNYRPLYVNLVEVWPRRLFENGLVTNNLNRFKTYENNDLHHILRQARETGLSTRLQKRKNVKMSRPEDKSLKWQRSPTRNSCCIGTAGTGTHSKEHTSGPWECMSSLEGGGTWHLSNQHPSPPHLPSRWLTDWLA